MAAARLVRCIRLAAFALVAAPSFGATYVPMSDAALVDQSPAVVIGTVFESRALSADSSTHTRIAVTAVLKGGALPSPLVVRVPGFVGETESLLVPGAPRFAAGERVLLFLAPRRDGTWAIVQFLLGAFHQIERDGRRLAVRDLAGSVALGGANGQEPPRDLERFADWIRSRARGRAQAVDYLAEGGATGFRSTSGDFTLLGHARWQVFDSAGSAGWQFHSAGWDGSGAGSGSFVTARGAWNADANTPIQYASAGTTASAGPGLSSGDGNNRIIFGDPNNEISGSFSCASGGVVAIGGYKTSGSHVFHGDGFGTIAEGDIVVQDGIACFFSTHPGADEDVFAHELGHTLGLGHSSDAAALMFASATSPYAATLGADDRAGICFLYGSSCPGVPPPSPPAAPTNLSATATSSSQIHLAWNDNSTNETSFRVEARSSGGSFSEIGSVGAGSTGANVAGLAAGTGYDFRVRARNGNGDSAYSNTASATTLAAGTASTPPAAPSNLQAIAASTSVIDLYWSDLSTNEESFRIEARSGGAPFAEIASTGPNASSISIGGLATGTGYDFRVRARNAAGDSASSNIASAETHSICHNGDPDVICLNGGRFAARITWRTPDGQQGVGHPVSLGADSAHFWFFVPDNIEVVVKVLDGCALSQTYWVFATGLTNVETHLTVTDTATHEEKTYDNLQSEAFQPLQDTAAFDTCLSDGPSASTGIVSPAPRAAGWVRTM